MARVQRAQHQGRCAQAVIARPQPIDRLSNKFEPTIDGYANDVMHSLRRVSRDGHVIISLFENCPQV
jgi:hypothetical protein